MHNMQIFSVNNMHFMQIFRANISKPSTSLGTAQAGRRAVYDILHGVELLRVQSPHGNLLVAVGDG